MSRKWMLRLGAAALVLAAGIGTTTAVAGATAGTDHILRGEKLVAGAQQKSNNGQYKLIQQKDGNLVEYRTKDNKVMWSTGTSGAPGAYTTLQKDGNLVVTRGANQKPLWKTGTDGSGATELVVQNDGNVVLYAGAGRSNPVWSTQGRAAGRIGDDYPSQWKNAVFGSEKTDSWGQYVRYCTSFVAWRLHDRNGFELPRWQGNASSWDEKFRAKTNKTPKVGAVAQLNNAPYGHVAWVAKVEPGRVLLEDYNWNLDGRYSQHWESAGKFNYIHLND